MKKYVLVALLAMILVVSAGCMKVTNPATGQTQYVLDPNKATAVETGVQAGIVAGTVVAPMFGTIGVAILGIVMGIFGAYKNLKPKLEEASTQAQRYYDVTAGIVKGVEDFKTLSPDGWAILEAKLTKTIGPEAENVIRALRNLPPKI